MKGLLTCLVLLLSLGLSRSYAQQQAPATTRTIKKPLPQGDSLVKTQSQKVVHDLNKEGASQKDKLARSASEESIQHEVKSTTEESIEVSGESEVKDISDDIKRDARGIKSEATRPKDQLKREVQATKSEVKNLSKADREKLLEDNATKLQYDSENPESTPWKENPLSGGDLKDQKLPLSTPNAAPLKDKPEEYVEKVKNLKPGANLDNPDRDRFSKPNEPGTKLEKYKRVADSLATVKNVIESDNMTKDLLRSIRVYSDQYKKKLYDSLGIKKADSIFNVASALAKTETPKEDLLSRINSSISGKGVMGTGFDADSQSIKMANADKLNGLPDQASSFDISKLKLPDSVLSDLAPLTGRKLDSKYLPVIDSMRDVTMRLKNQSLDEKQIMEDVKQAAVKKKPSFMDKIYFEGLITFVNDSTLNIFQISPSVGYHFTRFMSVGLGPNLLVQVQEKKVNFLGGFRSFVKAEIWKQRLYLQVEDNVNQMRINNDALRLKQHAVLAGGGGLLPITKSLAINLAVLYQVNKNADRPGHSPWVVRAGISSIKKINSER